ncbi:MAG: c-type cytochrome [Gemmatimonas sp.]
MRMVLASLLGAGLLALAPAAARADGADILKSQCSACHAVTPPAETTLDRLRERKAPDLTYAGVKFRRDWLVAWLQTPTRIRPAGYPYFRNVVPGDKGDEVDAKKLGDHPRLAAADANAVADALMALKPDGVVETGLYKDEKPNLRMGEMAFVKLRGCSACHAGKGGEGGRSGPELTDAGKRLQPDFIASYIKSPQKIDPHVWMPGSKVTDQDIQRLTGYIVQLSAGENK